MHFRVFQIIGQFVVFRWFFPCSLNGYTFVDRDKWNTDEDNAVLGFVSFFVVFD